MKDKYLRIIVGCVILIVSISTCILLNRKDTATDVTEQGLVKNNEKNQPKYSYPPPEKYYIDEDIQAYVNPINMDIYKKIYDAIDNIESEVNLSEFNITNDEFKKIKAAVLDRYNYEFFYLDKLNFDSKNKKIALSYLYNKNKAEELKKQFNEKIDYIVTKVVKPEYSELQKELAIYRYITENTEYNFKALKNESDDMSMQTILLKGTGICFGYAYTIKYLLNKVGIEAHIVKSDKHAWNVVKIDNVYYNLDATQMKPSNMSLFNFTDREITENWNVSKSNTYFGNQNYKKLKVPECNNDKFKFFREVCFYGMDGNKIYYASAKDKYNIYKINLDGSSKEKVSDTSVANMILVGEYLYYSDVNNGMHLYKMKKDGTDKKLVDDSVKVIDMIVKNNKLYYGNKKDKVEKQINL